MFKFVFLILFLISSGCGGGGGSSVSTQELEKVLDAKGCSDEVKDSYIKKIKKSKGTKEDIEKKMKNIIALVEKHGC